MGADGSFAEGMKVLDLCLSAECTLVDDAMLSEDSVVVPKFLVPSRFDVGKNVVAKGLSVEADISEPKTVLGAGRLSTLGGC